MAERPLVDLDCKTLWRKVMPPGSWAMACQEIDWSGVGQPREILVYGLCSTDDYAVIYDGAGNVVDKFAIPFKTPKMKMHGKEACFAMKANVWGDSRQEVILYGTGGVCIYSNARPLAVPTLYNTTVYPGM